MKYIRHLFLVLFLLIPFGVLAEESGTLANLKLATGQDSASTDCCDITRIIFHIYINDTATVQMACSVAANGGSYVDVGSAQTSTAIIETTFPCTSIRSDVTSWTNGVVTVDYKVIH